MHLYYARHNKVKKNIIKITRYIKPDLEYTRHKSGYQCTHLKIRYFSNIH